MSFVAKIGRGLVACVLGACALDGDPQGNGGGTDGTDGTDGTAGDDGPIVDGSSVTIFDVQQGKVAPMTTVRVENVIVTSPVNLESGGVFVQDPMGGPWSGIYVYLFDEVVQAVPLQPGDVVSLTAEYSEFYDFSELTVKGAGDLEVVGQGAAPEPLVVNPVDLITASPNAEQYEGVLVRVENVTVTNPDLGFGQFEVAAGVIVTNFFLFEQGAEIFPFDGATYDSVTGPLMYNFEEFKIAPRTATDVAGGAGQPEGPVSIYEIQQGQVPVGAPVLVEDVVVTTGLTFDGDTFFVQERDAGPHSGISVFVTDPQGLQVQPGELVTITGAYDEFYDNSQIRVTSVADIASAGTAEVPAPELVDAADIGAGEAAEPWEGVLVQVQDVVVSMEANDFGEWEVDQNLIVDDLFFTTDTWTTPPAQQAFESIAGVLTYSFERYKLAPREAADLVAGQ